MKRSVNNLVFPVLLVAAGLGSAWAAFALLIMREYVAATGEFVLAVVAFGGSLAGFRRASITLQTTSGDAG